MPKGASLMNASSSATQEPSWQLWGPYMSNREWGTVRQTGTAEGSNSSSLPYEKAAGTANRHCEDGIFGVCDHECRICHAYAFWNYKDDQLKERFFGVANGQGAHGEDVKELYYYRAADPQYRYVCAEYLYPQIEYPYGHLVDIERGMMIAKETAGPSDGGSDSAAVSLADYNNWHRNRRYFEIEFEMAKLAPDRLLFQLNVTNCADQRARIAVVPMLFLRNTSPAEAGRRTGEWDDPRLNRIVRTGNNHLDLSVRDTDGGEAKFTYFYDAEAAEPEVLLTENKTREHPSRGHFKDAFHWYIVRGDKDALMPDFTGDLASKAGICYRLNLAPKQQVKLRSLLTLQRDCDTSQPVVINWSSLDSLMEEARLKSLVDGFQSFPMSLVPAEQDILNAAYTTMLWNRQYYPLDRMPHLLKPQVGGHDLPTRLVTVPDKWEQPYLAAWDTALHCLVLSCFDQGQALAELMLLLALIRPDGSIYNDEYRPDGVTPPIIILAAIDVYNKCTPEDQFSLGPRIYSCLKSHLIWWLHRRDARGVCLIDGGVCGVDYVSLFPREILETGEGIIWAMFFILRFLELSTAMLTTPQCLISAAITDDLPIIVGYLGRLCSAFVRTVSQESGLFHPCWLDVAASKASAAAAKNENSASGSDQHQVRSDSWIDSAGGSRGHRNSAASSRTGSDVSVDGSWVSFSGVADVSTTANGVDAADDTAAGRQRCRWLHAYCYLPILCCCSLPNVPLRDRSTSQAADSLEDLFAAAFSGPADAETRAPFVYTNGDHSRLFVSAMNSAQLAELLEQTLSEIQFLAPYGIRTMSLLHTCDPAVATVATEGDSRRRLTQRFCPGASVSNSYGGNTNWYGSVNLPYNYLVLESMHKWSTVLQNKFDLIEYPSYTGRYRKLSEILQDLAARNVALFLPNASGIIPSTGDDGKKGLMMWETFDGDTGRGHGAAHKGGWSAIIARILFLMHGIE